MWGQNRNSIVAAMFSFVQKEFLNIATIDHKCMILGYSHMEVDNDHSHQEEKKKISIEIFGKIS